MELGVLLGIAVALLAVVISLTFYLKSKQRYPQGPERQRAVPNRVRDGAPRRAQMARNRGARLRANAARQDVNDSEPEEELEKDDSELLDTKIGSKKRAKLEAKAEKKAAREAEEQLRTERKKKSELAEEERKKSEEKEREEEKRREELERKTKEEKEKKEYEEYLKMKEAFSVEEEGFEAEETESQNILQEFVNYIKTQKVVLIEDLAVHFKLKTQAAIDRIKDLQKDDILTGVIDDRGKFIYVSPQEMEAVAKFIRQRGRVSIAELAENSNTLITLSPTAMVT